MPSLSDFESLFYRRPVVATVGLSIAAISFFATFIQNLLLLLNTKSLESMPGVVFVFDFIQASQVGGAGTFTWQQAVLGLFWSGFGLLSCYLALKPRNIARFTVVTFAGVKLFAFLAFADIVTIPLWQYVMTITIAILPIVLLLLPSSNDFYGRK
ncbi:MAG: hypothetical protein RLZZ251_498 [Actinomycetota bacterium]|jgi:hypothetical protein